MRKGNGTLSCFQYIKGTKKKANHNGASSGVVIPLVVSNTSKILKRLKAMIDDFFNWKS